MIKEEMAGQSLGKGEVEKSVQGRSELTAECYEQEMDIQSMCYYLIQAAGMTIFIKKLFGIGYFKFLFN